MDKRIWKVEALIENNPDISFEEILKETKYNESTVRIILKNLEKNN